MNIIEIGLAFLEGLALIASPCILPVLPLVLSTSVEGGRDRPYGIIFGFIISFSAFALGSSWIVNHLGINLDIIKKGSLIILALFGIVLLSTYLSEKLSQLTQRFANKGQQLAQSAQRGFLGGMVIGSLIGLVWTPCAGPILAAALVQIIRQESTLNSALMLLAFSLGAGLPMLIIAITGRELLNKMRFFVIHANAVRKVLGVLILLSVAYIASGQDIQAVFSKEKTPEKMDSTLLINPLPTPYTAPDFAGIEAWINSKPLKMEELKGKVVLIDFWTYSCINCIRTLPYITGWDEKYRSKGLVIVGVHSPEFEFEKKLDNVKAAVAKFNIHYPVALDNTLSTWQNFHNLYWPAHYLIDKNGRVVYTHFGEGDYNVTEQNIRNLLAVKDDNPPSAEMPSWSLSRQTPETYLGYLRQENFGNNESLDKDNKHHYAYPASLSRDQWGLEGDWKVEGEKIVSQSDKASLRLYFNAKKVFLVMGTKDNNPIKLTLLLNGKPIGISTGIDAPNGQVEVNQHRLYELVNQSTAENGLLEIQVNQPGLEAYAFTFGN